MLFRIAFCYWVLLLGLYNPIYLHNSSHALVFEMECISGLEKKETKEEDVKYLPECKSTFVTNNFILAIGETSGPTCGIPDNGFATIVPVDATGPFSYLWSNGDTTARIEDLTVGIYSVTVTDGLGCVEISLPITLEAQDPLMLTCPESVVVVAEENAADALLEVSAPDAGSCPLDDLFYTFTGATDQAVTAGEVGLQNFNLGITTINYLVPEQDECSFTVTVNPPITCSRLADSLVLIDFYNSTNGALWTNTWNLADPLDTWYGVTLNEVGCVSCLDLDGVPNCGESTSGNGNNVRGILPTSLGQLGALEGLYLTDNFIGGGLPASITQLPGLRQILLDNNLLTDALPLNLASLTSLDLILIDFNRLTFEDILHQIPFLTSISYDYRSQAIVFPDSIIQRNVGDDLIIDLGVDDTVSTNVYVWEKDGGLFSTVNGSNEVVFNDLQLSDAGIYTVTVTNPNAPDLTLFSGEITLEIIALPPSPVELTIPEVAATANIPVCVPISVSGFTDVSGFQFVLSYDTAALSFVELTNIHPNFSLDASVEANVQADGLLLNWVLLLGGSVDLPPDAVLAEVCFEPLQCGDQPLDIPLTGGSTAPEFITESLLFLPIEATGGNLNVSSDLELGLLTIGNPTCGQANGVVSVEVINGSGNYTYQWNVAGNMPILNNQSAGSYSLTVTDEESGCTVNVETIVLVNQGASTTMTIEETICEGESYAFNGEQLSESGTYEASFTTSPFNCDSTVTLILEVLPVPLAEIMGDTTFCLGDGPQTLTVAPATSYQWSTGSTTQSILIGSALTEVSVSVTNAAGCTSSDTVQILSGEAPQITISGDLTVCDGQSTSLTASGGIIYQWSNGSTNATTELLPGTHAVEVTNAAGCSNIELVTIINSPSPTLPAYESEQVGCGNGTLLNLELTLTAPLTADWYTEDNQLLAEGQTTYSPPQPGTYLARVRNTTTGCESVDVAIFNYSEEDILPPVIVDCPDDLSVVLNTGMMNEVTVNWTEPMAVDNCEVASLVSNLTPGSAISASTQVTYTATDQSGNETGCSFNINLEQTDDLTIYVDSARVTVIDDMARVPICVTNFTEVEGLSFSLRLLADTLAAEMLNFDSIYPALLSGLEMTLEGSPDTLLRFFWSDVSGNPTNLSLPDSSTLFHLLIELTGDPGACAQLVFADDPLARVVSKVGLLEGVPSTVDGPVCRPAVGTLAGYVRRADGSRIKDVEVSCESEEETLITYTDDMGYYEFADLLLGKSYTLTPRLDTLHRNGVNIIDRTLLSRHILQIQPLTTPYQRIAADVTGDGSINIIDFVQEGYMILQIFDVFPSNTSWRFVDAEYVFPNPDNPWSETFPEHRQLELLTKDSLQNNFIGIKIGDLNDSASSFGGGGASLETPAGPRALLEQDMPIDETSVLRRKSRLGHGFMADYLLEHKVIFNTEHIIPLREDVYLPIAVPDDD